MDYLWVIVFSEDIYYQINITDLYWFKKKPPHCINQVSFVLVSIGF